MLDSEIQADRYLRFSPWRAHYTLASTTEEDLGRLTCRRYAVQVPSCEQAMVRNAQPKEEYVHSASAAPGANPALKQYGIMAKPTDTSNVEEL